MLEEAKSRLQKSISFVEENDDFRLIEHQFRNKLKTSHGLCYLFAQIMFANLTNQSNSRYFPSCYNPAEKFVWEYGQENELTSGLPFGKGYFFRIPVDYLLNSMLDIEEKKLGIIETLNFRLDIVDKMIELQKQK